MVGWRGWAARAGDAGVAGEPSATPASPGGGASVSAHPGVRRVLCVETRYRRPGFRPPGGTAGEISFSGRPEIWSRAIYAIQDFPFTGTGLGTFRRVVNLLYPLFTISPDTDIAHAHNMFLQVAVDVGLPGLIAYLALLELAGVVAWERPGAVPGSCAPGLGLFAGLIALHVYGLTDAIGTGFETGYRALWMALGLIAALPRITEAAVSTMALTKVPEHAADALPPTLS